MTVWFLESCSNDLDFGTVEPYARIVFNLVLDALRIAASQFFEIFSKGLYFSIDYFCLLFFSMRELY